MTLLSFEIIREREQLIAEAESEKLVVHRERLEAKKVLEAMGDQLPQPPGHQVAKKVMVAVLNVCIDGASAQFHICHI